jgi:hypothetical protein
MKLNKKIEELFDEYLSTLDDTDKDQTYDTDRGIARTGIRGFQEWLAQQKRRPTKRAVDVGRASEIKGEGNTAPRN